MTCCFGTLISPLQTQCFDLNSNIYLEGSIGFIVKSLKIVTSLDCLSNFKSADMIFHKKTREGPVVLIFLQE